MIKENLYILLAPVDLDQVIDDSMTLIAADLTYITLKKNLDIEVSINCIIPYILVIQCFSPYMQFHKTYSRHVFHKK